MYKVWKLKQEEGETPKGSNASTPVAEHFLSCSQHKYGVQLNSEPAPACVTGTRMWGNNLLENKKPGTDVQYWHPSLSSHSKQLLSITSSKSQSWGASTRNLEQSRESALCLHPRSGWLTRNSPPSSSTVSPSWSSLSSVTKEITVGKGENKNFNPRTHSLN